MKFALMLAFAVTPAVGWTSTPQEPRVITDDEWCRDTGNDRNRESHCEVRELTLSAPQVLDIRQVSNGSISVAGSRRSDVRLRARVVASAPRLEEARQLAGAVTISTAGGRIDASGPRGDRDRSWWVSYRAEVPTAQDVELSTSNGSIALTDLHSRVRATTSNGSLHLSGTAGDVDVQTSNGSLTIQLSGTTWEGAGLRATTSNGSVRLEVPENYNARLRAGSNNGSISVDFPLPVQGRLTGDIETQLGTGGPVLDVRSSNGSIRIGRVRR
jgi:hypothetical protein